jgi:hypothetical protein
MNSVVGYLSFAGETYDPEDPRECRLIGRLRDRNRDDYMLVEIAPLLIGQKYGLGGHDISQLVLSSRLEGDTLFAITRWPVPVYVAIVVDDRCLQTHEFNEDHVRLIGWACLFPSYEGAASNP